MGHKLRFRGLAGAGAAGQEAELSRSSSGDEDGFLAQAAQEAENSREVLGKKHRLRSFLKEGRRRLERDKGSTKEDSGFSSVRLCLSTQPCPIWLEGCRKPDLGAQMPRV